MFLAVLLCKYLYRVITANMNDIPENKMSEDERITLNGDILGWLFCLRECEEMCLEHTICYLNRTLQVLK